MLVPGPRLMKKNLPGHGLTKVEKHCYTVVFLHRHRIIDILLVQQPTEQVSAASITLLTIEGQYFQAEQRQGSGGHKPAPPRLPPPANRSGICGQQNVLLTGFSQRTSGFPCQYHFTNAPKSLLPLS